MGRMIDRLLPRKQEERHQIATVDDYFTYMGSNYPLGLNQTWPRATEEEAPFGFTEFALRLFAANPVVFAAENTRMSVFSEARLQWRRFENGRPQDLFGDRSLQMFERPWPGGTTGDLLSRMVLHADLAGNAYVLNLGGRLKCLRPDWVTIVMGSELEPNEPGWAEDATVVGYGYTPGGKAGGSARFYLPNEVAHFAPQPDPTAQFRGMSWLTPIVREVLADQQATEHKRRFFVNGATPNMVVTYDPTMTKEQVREFAELIEARNEGVANAYKMMHLGGGADATVVGSDLQQLDFTSLQGKAETRIAMAAGVHPVILGASEGLAGSSLNAGNYATAKRLFADRTLRPLWRNAAASLSVLLPRPDGAELWYDDRDIPFLADDLKDTAEIQSAQTMAIRQLVDGGYDPSSVVSAINADDLSLLKHTGKVSVQLHEPGSLEDPAAAGSSDSAGDQP